MVLYICINNANNILWYSVRQNEGNCKIDTIDRFKTLCTRSFGKKLSYKKLIK